MINLLQTTHFEPFNSGVNHLDFLGKHMVKIPNGVLLFCIEGEADITLNLKKYHIVPDTTIMIIPNSIISIKRSDTNFKVHYFAFSQEMFRAACFRLDPAFVYFLKENGCYTHVQKESLRNILALIEGIDAIYKDSSNRFRQTIAQNLLQNFLLDTYDKVQRLFPDEQIEGSNRKEQLFKKFVNLIHVHCTTERNVGFYAEKLCISNRYLSAVTRQMGNISAKEMIDDFLILEIKVALESTDLSLKEIADQFQFPDQSFFGRYFKKHTGLSPKEYRMRV